MLKRLKMFFSVWFLLIGFCLFYANPVFAEDIHILKISPEDESAVIKEKDGKTQILRVGDRIGLKGWVVEIVEGRVVIEERTDQGVETVIIRFERGKQRVERIRKIEDRSPTLYSPSPGGERR